MLYDPNWKKPDVKITDPLTIESLIAWLEEKPAAARYDYEDCSGKCLYGLYMADHGVGWKHSGAGSRLDSGSARADFCALVYLEVASSRPWSFGAALKRARRYLAQRD